MKFTKIAIALTALLALSTPAHADLWTLSKNAGLKPEAPDAKYRVETKGLDVRVYEWTPAGSPDTVCIMAFGQTHPVGLQCVPKVRTNED